MPPTDPPPTEARSDRCAYKPLEEYGVIGNLETVALVGRDGAIDWCPLPHVESPSVFARLLDSRRGGHFAIAPMRSFDAHQSYLERTNVLQTRFETAGGRATVTDFMPVVERPEATTPRAIYRRVTCEDGDLDLGVSFAPRFDYARTVPTFESARDGVAATSDDERLFLSSSVPLEIADDGARASFTLTAGDDRWFVLGYDRQVPHRPAEHRRRLDAVVDDWRDWAHSCPDASACPVGGPWHDLTVRSGLALKLLTHRETGAICAAPTTSLPEVVGGVRNWDYRYNWIRDAAFTVQAFATLGHLEEARDYFEMCLHHCSQMGPSGMQPVYGLHGETDLDERTLDHLEGYCESSPVRVGNEAADQRQLDVFGELVVGVHEVEKRGVRLAGDYWPFLREVVDHVCEVWDEPDVGIWEMRTDPQQFVYSKVMCWAAVDRGIEFVEDDSTGLEGPVDEWRETRETIREAVLDRGYDEEVGSFVRSFEADDLLDAAVLRLPVVEFLPADDPRIQGTVDAVLDRMTTADGLVARIEGDDGLPGDEGAFVVCSFWLVNALALAGRVEEATDLYESVCEFVTPLGLLAEEVDRETGRQLGNFPQAFSQIGLVNSAVYLADRGATPETEPQDGYPKSASSRSEASYTGMAQEFTER